MAMAATARLEVRMPHMGVSVTEGTVTAWLKAPGDPVAAEEAVCEVSTDKVDTEVPAPAAGRLAEIVAGVGDTVPVGAPLAILDVTDGSSGQDAGPARAEHAEPLSLAPPEGDRGPLPEPESVAAAGAEQAAPTAARTPGAAAAPGAPRRPRDVEGAPFDHRAALEEVARRGGRRGGPLASPVARRIAQAHGIDLTGVVGSGKAGRIRKRDILGSVETAAGPPVAPAPGPAAAPEAVPATGIPRGYEDVPHEVVPTSRIRKVTAEHMIRSRQTAAHMTTEVEVDMEHVASVRAAVNEQRLAARARKLSYLPFLARVAVAALREFPNLNATFETERYIRWRQINLGIAVETPQGLLVPVIRGCEDLTVDALGERIVDVAERARAKQLTADDHRAGTFTISNPGSVGAVSAMAIINQPQVAILGVPAIVRRPWVVPLPGGGESIAIRPILNLAITFDHRAIDGAEATRCAVLMKRCLETWDEQAYS
jgi:2-oxoglutarate dehydrogenase E2 component (dihydrolipoamide succinyltransferase)